MADTPDPQAGIAWLREICEEELTAALSGRAPRTDATPDPERELAIAALALGAGDDERFERAVQGARLMGVPTARLVDLVLLSIAPLGPARAARAADVVRRLCGEGPGGGSWVLAALEKEIPEAGGREVQVAGRAVAILRSGDRFHAVQAHCPHRRGPMADGIVENGQVTCALHAWTFDLASGACEGMPGASISVFATKSEGGKIYIRI